MSTADVLKTEGVRNAQKDSFSTPIEFASKWIRIAGTSIGQMVFVLIVLLDSSLTTEDNVCKLQLLLKTQDAEDSRTTSVPNALKAFFSMQIESVVKSMQTAGILMSS